MICYLSLGANLGRRAQQLAQAISELASEPELVLRRVSPVYETVPVGYAPGPDNPNYLNLVLCLEAACEPLKLLALTQALEVALGRERSVPNAPRTIDIDLLACGDIMQATGDLILPHPRMWERQFVIAPLADIAPAFRTAGGGPAQAFANPHDPQVRPQGTLGDLVRRGL